MIPTLRELRLGWAVLATAAAAAVLPDNPTPWLVALWAALATTGAVTLVRARWNHPPAAPVNLIHLTLLAGLLMLVGLVFGASPALLLAMAIGLAAMRVARRRGSVGLASLLDRLVAFGGALVVVLLPLELVMRIPSMAREFGLPVERARQLADYDSLWTRNVFRFRSPHERIARRPGVTRVIALGDSFTWGLQVSSSDSVWPALLQGELSAGSSRPTEVINMGQRGWTTANEAELLRRLGWQFEPDLVIVQFYVNDAYPSTPGFQFAEPPRVWLLPDQFWKGYVRSSALAALVSRAINGIIYGVLGGNDESQRLYAPDAEGYRQLRAALREMGDSAASRGVPVLFVLFPSLLSGNWTPKTYPLRDLYGQIAGHARDAGLRVLDLSEAFAAQGGDWSRWWSTPYDAHPSAAAHLVVAKAIADYTRRTGLLAKTP